MLKSRATLRQRCKNTSSKVLTTRCALTEACAFRFSIRNSSAPITAERQIQFNRTKKHELNRQIFCSPINLTVNFGCNYRKFTATSQESDYNHLRSSEPSHAKIKPMGSEIFEKLNFKRMKLIEKLNLLCRLYFQKMKKCEQH